MDKTIAAVKALIEKGGEYLFVGIEYGEKTIWVPPRGKLEKRRKPDTSLKQRGRT